jgi:hypothetical protein
MAFTVKSRRRAASSIDMSGSPETMKPRWPRPAFESRRGKRDVDRADLVDLKAFADRFDAAEAVEQRPQACGGDAEDLESRLVGLVARVTQVVAHPAADDERAPAASRTALAIATACSSTSLIARKSA